MSLYQRNDEWQTVLFALAASLAKPTDANEVDEVIEMDDDCSHLLLLLHLHPFSPVSFPFKHIYGCENTRNIN